jgi:DNA-binding PucR family transcriptional regulator
MRKLPTIPPSSATPRSRRPPERNPVRATTRKPSKKPTTAAQRESAKESVIGVGLPSLQSILELPAFKSATVVSGFTQLTRSVTWVHVAEVLDVWRFLSGGEFLLSTGIQLANATREQRSHYIRSLIRARASGLGIETVRTLQDLPTEMLRIAEEASFPIILFRSEVSFASLTRAAHERILRPRQERNEDPSLAPIFDALVETGRDRIFLERQLGPVLALPRRQRVILLGTLESLLEAQFNIAETARRLKVRRQSIYYRLAQLSTLLGSLDDPQRKVGFLIAFALLRRSGVA